MKETLQCAQCDRNWRREKTRGRKPTICPKCIKAEQKAQAPKATKKILQVTQFKKQSKTRTVVAVAQTNSNASSNQNDQELSVGQIFHYYHPSDDKLREETKGGSKWKCRCGYILEMKFSVSAIPTHKCTENGKSIPMERLDK